MKFLLREITAMTIGIMVASSVAAQSVSDIIGPSPLVAIENEPAAKLFVDPPLPGPLSKGRVFIQYRTENLRVVPVFFGMGGHLKDDLPRLVAEIRRTYADMEITVEPPIGQTFPTIDAARHRRGVRP